MEPDLYAIGTTPEFGIGQRALLVRTPHGNLLWDRVYAAFWDREILAGGKAAVECSRALRRGGHAQPPPDRPGRQSAGMRERPPM